MKIDLSDYSQQEAEVAAYPRNAVKCNQYSEVNEFGERPHLQRYLRVDTRQKFSCRNSEHTHDWSIECSYKDLAVCVQLRATKGLGNKIDT